MGTKSSNSTKKTAVKKVAKLVKGNKPATAPAKAAKAPKAKKERNPKYIGKTSGLRVQAFQDKLMKDNYRAKLTDAALAKAMRDEFPNAIAFTEKHVAGIRSQWNHGHRPTQEGAAPDKMLARFDEEGQAMSPRARATKAEKPTKAAKAAKPVKTVKGKKAAPPPPDEDEEDVEDEDESDEDDDLGEDDEE